MSNRSHQSNTSPLRVLLVDDHSVVRFGIRYALMDKPRFHVIAEASNYAEAREAVDTLKPDLIVQDLLLSAQGGVELIREWLSLSPQSRILVLSQQPEALFAERALRAGAHGYVMKSEDATELLQALDVVADGGVYLSHAMNQALLLSLRHNPAGLSNAQEPESMLSDREQHILLLIGQGMATGEIARQLHLSVKTVGAHRENIKTKMKLRDASQLEAAARSFALRQEPP